eukprot:3047206-Lingulodinium_polyedra.AAC.1
MRPTKPDRAGSPAQPAEDTRRGARRNFLSAVAPQTMDGGQIIFCAPALDIPGLRVAPRWPARCWPAFFVAAP